MLANVHEYGDINRLTFLMMYSLIICTFAKTAYLAIVQIVGLGCCPF